MTDVEAFLQNQKRYRCDRLAANLTVEQCQENRVRQPNLQKGISAIMQCEGCAGLGKAVEIKEKGMATEKACSECGQIKKIHSHGQCAKCLYAKYGKSMRPAVKVEVEPETPDFSGIQCVQHVDDYCKRNPAPLMPIILAPLNTLELSIDIVARMKTFSVSSAQLLDIIDAFLHGELERHPYRRAV